MRQALLLAHARETVLALFGKTKVREIGTILSKPGRLFFFLGELGVPNML